MHPPTTIPESGKHIGRQLAGERSIVVTRFGVDRYAAGRARFPDWGVPELLARPWVSFGVVPNVTLDLMASSSCTTEPLPARSTACCTSCGCA